MISKYIEYIPFVFLLAWLLFSVYYIILANSRINRINKYLLESIPQIFATIGILGTFMEIAYALSSFSSGKIDESIPVLLDRLKTVFFPSISGIILLIISSKFIDFAQSKYDKVMGSPELDALNRIVDLLENMQLKLDANMNVINSIGSLYSDIAQLSRALQNLGSDLEKAIDAGFENMALQQDESKTIVHLQNLNREVNSLYKKMDELGGDISKSAMSEIQMKLEKMLQDFRMAIAMTARAEFETMSKFMKQAIESLSEVPMKYESLADDIEENLNQLQTKLEKAVKESLSQSGSSAETMLQQIKEISDIIKYFYTLYS